jgi:hypothetical protein
MHIYLVASGRNLDIPYFYLESFPKGDLEKTVPDDEPKENLFKIIINDTMTISEFKKKICKIGKIGEKSIKLFIFPDYPELTMSYDLEVLDKNNKISKYENQVILVDEYIDDYMGNNDYIDDKNIYLVANGRDDDIPYLYMESFPKGYIENIVGNYESKENLFKLPVNDKMTLREFKNKICIIADVTTEVNLFLQIDFPVVCYSKNLKELDQNMKISWFENQVILVDYIF